MPVSLTSTYFNARHRAGSDRPVTRKPITPRYFNPRHRAGSDEIKTEMNFRRTISIHATAQAAIGGKRFLPYPEWISIHATAQAAMVDRNIIIAKAGDFNPRHRAGSDSCDTHTHMSLGNFNPRHRAGSDSKNTQTSSLHLVYNIILFSYLQLISTDSSHFPPPLLPIFSNITSANLPVTPYSLSIRTRNSPHTYT